MIFFQPINGYGLTCHNCYPGCDMVRNSKCKCPAGYYSICESEYHQNPAGQCNNNNSDHISNTNSENCKPCLDGTGTAADAPTAYRAFCTTCYAGTYSTIENGVRICKTCENGYWCAPINELSEPDDYFTCENFFMGKHAESNGDGYKTWSSNPGSDCGARLVTGPGVGHDCTEEDNTPANIPDSDPDDEEDDSYSYESGEYVNGWKFDRQGTEVTNKVRKPLWYCEYDANRFGPGVKEDYRQKCFAGTYAYVNIEKYGAYTPSGIQRGATECRDCLPGSYSSSDGSSQCTLCKPGTYQDLGGQTSCKPCPQRTYQDEAGQTNCKVCPDPWMTTDGTGKTSVDDCNVQITTMRFTTTETDGCSWQWPTNDSSSLVTGGSFMQVLPNDKVKVNLKDTCVEETDGDCKVQD